MIGVLKVVPITSVDVRKAFDLSGVTAYPIGYNLNFEASNIAFKCENVTFSYENSAPSITEFTLTRGKNV